MEWLDIFYQIIQLRDKCSLQYFDYHSQDGDGFSAIARSAIESFQSFIVNARAVFVGFLISKDNVARSTNLKRFAEMPDAQCQLVAVADVSVSYFIVSGDYIEVNIAILVSRGVTGDLVKLEGFEHELCHIEITDMM